MWKTLTFILDEMKSHWGSRVKEHKEHFKRITAAVNKIKPHRAWMDPGGPGRKQMQQSYQEMMAAWSRVVMIELGCQILDIFLRYSKQDFLKNWIHNVKKIKKGMISPSFLAWATGRMKLLLPGLFLRSNCISFFNWTLFFVYFSIVILLLIFF